MTQQNPLGSNGGADEFEIMRQRLKSRGAARGAEAQRGVRRDAAALGNLPSGAALKQKQMTAQRTEEQTGTELQDVNILQAQTQRAERESAAARELQRFGITEGSRVAERGQDITKFGIESQAETALKGFDVQKYGIDEQTRTTLSGQAITEFGIKEQSRVAIAAQVMQESIAERGWAADKDILALKHTNDMFILAEQGATQLELQTAQNTFDKEQQARDVTSAANAALLVEKGMDQRIADTIASNEKLQGMADSMAQKGIDIQQELADTNATLVEQENMLNTVVTIISAFDPLRALGFDNEAIADLLDTLDMPFSDAMKDLFENPPPTTPKPTNPNPKPNTTQPTNVYVNPETDTNIYNNPNDPSNFG